MRAATLFAAVAAGAVVILCTAFAYLCSRHLEVLEEVARLQAVGGASASDAARAEHAQTVSALHSAQDEVEKLRAATVSMERLCVPGGGTSEQAPEPGGSSGGVECKPRTVYLPMGEPLSEMHFVRDYLVREYGWQEVTDSEVAAVVLSTGDSPPVKRPCSGETFEDSSRVAGPFGRELEVCQKHKLFVRFSDDGAGRPRPSPDEVATRWPWLPKTYLLDRPEHSAALDAALPCAGPQRSYFVKGDAHGGRAVWLPDTYQELRALVRRPCKGQELGPADAMDAPPRLVQESIDSVLWDGRSIMVRVFMVALRRGRTRLSADRGRWSLGLPPPAYELHVYDAPLVTQYPGQVRDSASEDLVLRRNASELEAFARAELARQGRRTETNWFTDVFMAEARSIAAASFAASATPWPWDLPQPAHSGDATDLMKAASLEPDGAFLFLAQELLLDKEMRVRLIEYTCVPADIHGLQAQFSNLPWTRAFAEELGAQLASLLLRNAGQAPGEGPRSGVAPPGGRWTKVAERGPFPHP